MRNADVWTRDGILANRDVLVRDGRVASIERTGVRRPEGVRTIEGTGHTLLPGLVDVHLHFSMPGGLPASGGPRTDAAEITGRQLLASGVTSGRLHLAPLEEAVQLQTRSADDCEALPRVQAGGPGLSGAAEKDFSAFQGAKSREDAVAKIERFRAAGVRWLAVHDADRFAPDVLTAIGEAARRVGLRLMASGSTPQEITAALGLRPDTLDYFDRTAEPSYTPAVLDAIRAERDLILAPTPGVPYRTGQYLKDHALLERPESFVLLEPADRAFVVDNARKALTGPEAERAARLLPSLPRKFQQLRETGLPMALVSDAGSTLHFQADAIWWELEAWRTLGASHREALVAATETAALVLRDDEIGQLAVGRRADFVLYRGRVENGPLDRAHVVAVAKGGVMVK